MSEPITLFFLQASRAIRTAWIMEELDIPYTVVFSERTSGGLGEPDFKKQIGTKLGKSPSIKDGDLTVQESIVIAEYLCEKFDKASRLIPPTGVDRVRVKEWMVASEAAFFVHAGPILYLRRAYPGADSESILSDAVLKLSGAVEADFDWLEEELSKGDRKYLVGDHLTAADIMVHFSAQFLLAKKHGTERKAWRNVERWVKELEQEDSYKRAVQKTGYKL